MYVGTQITPRDDSDYRVWAQLGVSHVCVDPPGNPHHWSLDDLHQHREHIESFGLTLDMVQLPMSSRSIEAQESPHILLGKEPQRQQEIDSICALIERLAAAGIPAAKYNLTIVGIPRTEREAGRGGSRNAAFRWSRADQSAPPTAAGIESPVASGQKHIAGIIRCRSGISFPNAGVVAVGRCIKDCLLLQAVGIIGHHPAMVRALITGRRPCHVY